MNHHHNNNFRKLEDEDELIFRLRGEKIKHQLDNKVEHYHNAAGVFDLFFTKIGHSVTMLLGGTGTPPNKAQPPNQG